MGCSAIEKFGGGLLTTFGASDDAFCDRRVTPPERVETRAPFCQEIFETVALSEFLEDCQTKFAAKSGEGPCDRTGTLGGCVIDEVERDGSQVTDWFFADDAGPSNADAVRVLCADRKRYERGAHYVSP